MDEERERKNNQIMKYVTFGITVVIFIVALLICLKVYKNLSRKADNINPISDETEMIKAPDFTVYDADGKSVKLSECRGKPVVVNFWATWCGYCLHEFPTFEKVAAEYGDDVRFLMVNMTDGTRETKELSAEYIKENGYTFPIYFDTDMQAVEAYQITAVPVTLFIDGHGRICENHLGVISEDALREYIETLKRLTIKSQPLK